MTKNEPQTRLSLPPIDDKLGARLANGARLRAEIQRQIERGEEPLPHYRVEWLRDTAREILARGGEER